MVLGSGDRYNHKSSRNQVHSCS